MENAADQLGDLDRRVKGDMARFKDFIERRGGRETGARCLARRGRPPRRLTADVARTRAGQDRRTRGRPRMMA